MKTRSVVVGIGGAAQNAAVSVCIDGQLRAFCEQERVTRVRRIGLTPGTLPTEALAAALEAAGGFTRGDVATYATAEPSVGMPDGLPATRVDHHRGHAATAFYLSPFGKAAALVCDSRAPATVWTGADATLRQEPWPEDSESFAQIYAHAARLFGFSPGQEHELEGLARLGAGNDAERFDRHIGCRSGVLRASPEWMDVLRHWLGERAPDDLAHRAQVASAFQRHLGSLLLSLVREVHQQTQQSRLCVGGGLFFNTAFTTLVKQSGIFDEVFTAPNPGNAGAAIGAALDAGDTPPVRSDSVPAFLGPEFTAENIKSVLDNCKLSYEVLDEGQLVETVARALTRGQLVGWFQGRMEWGHRALGNRSILANPFSPYVLDNLNVFLKQRPRHRSYGVSVPDEDAARIFDGPPSSHFMEYEYRPTNMDEFRHVLPAGTSSIRVQTIPASDDRPVMRYRHLHHEFAKLGGQPVLVNTSLNGFSEPMACSPRDAIRVFFGTGLDLLVLDRFVVRK